MDNTPIEIERKYIIEKPELSRLGGMSEYSSSEITQIYLESVPSVTHRIRRRQESDGEITYTETKKIRIDKISAYEDEKEVSRERFDELRLLMRRGTSPIIKTRHSFKYKDQLFEIDIYPEWKDICIMETELRDREKSAEMPEFIKIKAEVSGMREFSNASLAQNFPFEENIKFKTER